jgi:hypothetical protein
VVLVELPTHFDDRAAVDFATGVSRHADQPDLVLSFRSVQFVRPYGTLLVAHAIKHIAATRRGRGLKTNITGHDSIGGAVSYLRYFGFFKYINLESAQNAVDAPGGSRYIPITTLNRTTLSAIHAKEALQDNVEATSQKLATVLSGSPDAPAALMLSYCFRELIRNTFEHADVSTCAVMAQRWDNGFAEVAIADRGIGIYEALRSRHKVGNPHEALTLALKPGISSRVTEGTGSKWDNTGFGLYVLSQLGQRYGSFSVLSSQRFLSPSRSSESEAVPLPGTLIKLRISTDDAEYWPNILHNIVAEGEAEAKFIPGAVTSASAGSKSVNTWLP